MARTLLLSLSLLLLQFTAVQAEDWSRFRGPSGSGVTGSNLATAWSPSANIGWKTEMPGPGASSPIIVGDKAFVTCYSGYGLDQQSPGEIENLMRHLVCVDLKTGKKLWQKDLKATMPEDPYTGIGVTAHGYASHTPVSDGTNVYAFFGKGGVHAFDMSGKELWQTSVGKESDPTRWGSSSSPITYKDMVIITASAESQSIVALNKKTGKEVWRQEAKGLDGMWGTPSLVKVDDSRTDLVMCVAKELWGLNPDDGTLRWFAGATNSQHAYTSVIMEGKKVFAFTGRDGGSVAVEAGGSGDVSKSMTKWTGRVNASFASPVRHKDKIYVVAQNILSVVDANSGKRVSRMRLESAKQTGGRFGSLDYPSPIVAGNHLYYMNGSGQMYVFDLAGEELKQVALNSVTADKEIFWGTPAVSGDKLVMRSSKHLYCVMDKGEKVDQDPSKLSKAGNAEEAPAEGAGGRRGGGRRFDPNAMFAQMDTDKDGKISMKELEGNRMADRLKTLDKDKDEAISKEEFTGGIMSLFRRGGGSGGGSRGGGRGGYGNRDKRPERPQRPRMSK